ncbi:YfbK domain-containing protein [Oleiharenicola sp. Vm1]|uniref:YfbK domain-containing protein n=1 Tax=Oleiharenicola sp. Vm1 TaxID=3398393 RepID=UPI0039F5DEA6
MSASAQTPAATSAVVADVQRRHATALRSYALELWDGDAARADKSLAAFWRNWRPAAARADDLARDAVFGALRRHVVADQRRAGPRAESASDDSADEPTHPSERVAARFRQLTPKQQEALRLRLRHGFETEEIAQITELSAAHAAQLIHTALARLNGTPGEDARLTQLAFAGATAEQLAGESPEHRARVAELRVTLEVARQVLARGVEAFAPQRRRGGPRRTVWIAAGLAVAALLVGGALWMRRRSVNLSPSRTGSKARAPRASQSPGPHRPTAIPPHAPPPARRTPPLPAAHHATSARGRRGAFPGRSGVRPRASALRARRHPDRRGRPRGTARLRPRGGRRRESRRTAGPAARPAGKPRSSRGNVPRNGNAGRGSGCSPAARAQPAAPPPAGAPAPASPVPVAAPSSTTSPPADIASSASPARSGLSAARLDTAPIAALRRALEASRWPERRQVNVAALVNRAPAGSTPPGASAPVLVANVESSAAPGHAGRRLVRVALRAREAPPAPRAPATVILLLDVSGSMDAPNRLPLVQEAAVALLRRLRPEDRVGLVTYAGESRVLLRPTALAHEAAVRAAIEALTAQGRTNGGAGLREAFALAAADRDAPGEHVVLLCTDGDFNMGETSEAELGALIDRHRDAGVRLAIFGFGRPDRIDARLEALAARAHGGSGYVNTRAEAEQALATQLDALFAPVAEDLTATVEFDPAQVARYRRLGDGATHEAARETAVTFARRERVLPGETVAALFEIEPVAGAPAAGAALRVRASAVAPAGPEARAPFAGTWPAAITAGDFAGASVDFRFAAAMAAFGEALQAGPAEGAAQLDAIERWARGAVGEDAGGYRAELLAWIAQARRAAGR